MMQKLQNRSTAAIITLCVVVLSVLLGSGLSLSRLRNEALHVFRSGVDSGRGVSDDLRDITGNASNLLTVAGRYMNPNDVLIDAVERAIDQERAARNPAAVYQAASELEDALRALDNHLRTLGLSEDDRIYREKIAANIEATYRIIGRNPYNEYARAFNEELSAFPASLLANLTGVDPLELYG